MGIRDFKFLLNNEHEISMDQLEKLLMDNSISDYDPVAEAFKFYDPENTGFINTSVLRSLFENLGFGKLTDDDLRILVRIYLLMYLKSHVDNNGYYNRSRQEMSMRMAKSV